MFTCTSIATKRQLSMHKDIVFNALEEYPAVLKKE